MELIREILTKVMEDYNPKWPRWKKTPYLLLAPLLYLAMVLVIWSVWGIADIYRNWDDKE